jgi:hypothetical protein
MPVFKVPREDFHEFFKAIYNHDNVPAIFREEIIVSTPLEQVTMSMSTSPHGELHVSVGLDAEFPIGHKCGKQRNGLHKIPRSSNLLGLSLK